MDIQEGARLYLAKLAREQQQAKDEGRAVRIVRRRSPGQRVGRVIAVIAKALHGK